MISNSPHAGHDTLDGDDEGWNHYHLEAMISALAATFVEGTLWVFRAIRSWLSTLIFISMWNIAGSQQVGSSGASPDDMPPHGSHGMSGWLFSSSSTFWPLL